MSEHGVELVQLLDSAKQRLQKFLQVTNCLRAIVTVLPYQRFFLLWIQVRECSDIHHELFTTGQKLVEGRIESANRNGKSVHSTEDADEILALHAQQFFESGPAIFFAIRQNHGAHVRNFLLAKEHVFSAAQADSLGAESTSLNSVAR